MRPRGVRDQQCYVCGAPTRQSRVLLDVDTAMRLARASRITVYRWMREGKVEWVTLPGGEYRIYLDSLFHDPPYRRPEGGPGKHDRRRARNQPVDEAD